MNIRYMTYVCARARAGYILQGTKSGTGIYLSGRSNVTIKNMEVKKFVYGIYLRHSNNNSIYGNNITNNWVGVNTEVSSYNTISGNNITANYRAGIQAVFCKNNVISGNNIANNEYGIYLNESSDNKIYHNNFINSVQHVHIETSGYANFWDDGYPSGGNYWSDHVTVDDYSGINQDELGSDGIVDEPYVIDDYNRDNYPLVKPWSPVISATIDVAPDTLNLYSKGEWITCYIELPEGYNVSDIDIYSVKLNNTFPVSLLPNPPVPVPMEIGDYDSDTIPDLMVKFNRTEVASWVYNDLGIQYGNVTLTITGELFDGTPFEGTDTVKVLFPGDADDDGAVTSRDLSIFAGCYGTSIENPSYDLRADFNEDGYINSEDLSIIAGNYGKTAL